ncbi:MAG: ABC transporter permease, partial [Verrucomicrobiaceae bacterium]
STEADQGWTKVISSHRGFFDIPWRDVWRYRDLILLLAKRDLSTSYKQTVLGPFWFVLQPLMVTVVFSYLFGRLGRLGTDDIPHYLFYMSGLVVWGFFAECVNKTSRTFSENQQVFGKVYFPRLVAPMASVLTNSIPLMIQLGIFVIGILVYIAKGSPYVHPNWLILLTPLIFVTVAMLGLGIGCIVASLTKRFRDLVYGVQVGLQLWMFGSAIVFPLSRISPDDRWIFFLNPIVPMVEFFRLAFVGVSLVSAKDVLFSVITAVVALAIGVLMFNRAEQTSMDTV